jgi:sulfide:quinone oxidoreductase
MIYNADSKALFGVPPVNKEVIRLFAEREIAANYEHVLTAIDPGRREASYRTASGTVTMDYDFIHVVPPMSAPDSLKASPLAWQEGPFASSGWLEVDKHSLRHRRYPNVFGIGDINGVPRGKTAASVKMQAPVAIHNLLEVIQGREPDASYNGYTSCPLITGVGSAMLVEFDYDGKLIPSFPFIDPLKEGWVPWLLKESLLQPAYHAVLRGTV